MDRRLAIRYFYLSLQALTSASTQNPSLTYMTLTARASDYAFAQLKKGA